MRVLRNCVVALTLVGMASPVLAGKITASPAVEVSPMKVDLGYSISLNKNSSLNRISHFLNDDQSPIQLAESTIDVIYKSESRGGEYQYSGRHSFMNNGAIVAYELRHVVYNVFGERLSTLSEVKVANIGDEPGRRTYGDAKWRIFSENTASEAFMTVSYVANVRTASGKVWTADYKNLAKALVVLNAQAKDSDLIPKPKDEK